MAKRKDSEKSATESHTKTKTATEPTAPKLKLKHCSTYESTAYLRGLFGEFQEQCAKYSNLTGQLLAMEARIELSEKTLCLTRDHFAMTIQKTQDAVPNDWNKVMRDVRFVGVRLADACLNSLQTHKKMTPDELLRDLNDGMFRFRTNSPLREIHAALLKNPNVTKNGRTYVWNAPAAEQIPMRLRVTPREVVMPGLNRKKETPATADMGGRNEAKVM